MAIWDWLKPGAGDGADEDEGDAVRAIIANLERLDPGRARAIAGFAYILGRVANVDLEIRPEETRTMERLVHSLGGLARDEAALVVQIAKSQHLLFGSTENYVVTREFARASTHEEKIALLECLFAVSAADQEVSGEEEAEIRTIAGELDLSHEEFIEARLKVRDYIASLKPPAPPEA